MGFRIEEISIFLRNGRSILVRPYQTTFLQWRGNLGDPTAEDLRELAVTLHKLRMDPSRCALGVRVVSIIKILGLNEELYEFLSVTYKDCITLGIKPDKVAHNLKHLLELCENIPSSQIPGYIEQQKTRKQKLEQELQELESREVDAKNRVDKALKEEGIARHDLNFRRELWKQETSVDEISQFLEALEGVKQLGFDPPTVVSRYRNFIEREAGRIAIEELRNEVNRLQEEVAVHSQVMKKYQELESMDFGLKELKQLANMVREIAEANTISPHYAIQKFLADVEEQYDEKLGFESKLESLKAEIQKYQAAKNRQAFEPSELPRLMRMQTEQGTVNIHDNGTHETAGSVSQQQQQDASKAVNAADYGSSTHDLQSSSTNTKGASTSTLNTMNNNFAHETLGSQGDEEEQEQEEELYKSAQQQQTANNNELENQIQNFISNSLARQGRIVVNS